MTLKEELFDHLLKVLQEVLNREPSTYRFLVKNSEEGLEDYSRLDLSRRGNDTIHSDYAEGERKSLLSILKMILIRPG